MSVVQPRLQLTLSTLQQLKEKPGLNTRKVQKLLQSLEISPSDQQVNAIQLSEGIFLDSLVANIRCRFEGSDVVLATSVFCNTSETSALCGSEDLELLAKHYSMDSDNVMEEWNNLTNMMADLDPEKIVGQRQY